MNTRGCLLSWFQSALRRVNGAAAVRAGLRDHPLATGTWHGVAIGKAACAMARGAGEVLGDTLASGFLVTKKGYLDATLCQSEVWHCHEAEHPVPGPGSLAAGNALLEYLYYLPDRACILFLISGGASSLVEVLLPGMNLDGLRKVNGWLLSSGLDINAINRVRQRISQIKGGRLRSVLGNRIVIVLLISDVPGDDIRAMGSGLLAEPLPGTLPPVPAWLKTWLDHAVPGHEMLSAVPHFIVARLTDAMDAIEQAAQDEGWSVFRSDTLLSGDAEMTGRRLGRQLLGSKAGVWLWGGETTVRLPPDPGLGGRNQHVALAAAVAIKGQNGINLLAAGTDGTDGLTPYAGALVDGGSVARGRAAGLDPVMSLHCADAGHFLAASGDLIQTGPTGTNVMDLVIGLRWSGAEPGR